MFSKKQFKGSRACRNARQVMRNVMESSEDYDFEDYAYEIEEVTPRSRVEKVYDPCVWVWDADQMTPKRLAWSMPSDPEPPRVLLSFGDGAARRGPPSLFDIVAMQHGDVYQVAKQWFALGD